MADNRCPSCGGPLPANSPAGACPRCLLLQGLDTDPPGLERVSNDRTLDQSHRAGSVLETIGATIGVVPRVLLRDTAVGEEPSPIVRAVNGEEPSIRYRIDGEIARGGMGAILKGRDSDLCRDVAIKVLREDRRDDGDLVRRFVEEAQIGGQLQHPGVVPIYELGTFADRRPYFSMKLVKGQTLADLLADRPAPSDDLPRSLSIYAAIAQTIAYAHTRGVIHRDLKPSNVMVGSFGEVQVMDWGLAKVLPRGGVDDDAKAGKEPPPETLISTARSGSDTDHSHAGSVLGTPSYMPPEQARGETDRVDERADVFALGSILCEILTGSPAFTGRNSTEILRKAGRGETVDALARLDGCGAEGELIALARECLAVEPEDRPRDAKVVADRITAYLAGVQERVQAAERERAVAVARAIEERRRRKVQLALAASVLALTTLAGLSTTYYLQQRAAQAAAYQRVIDQVTTLHNQAVAQPEDIQRWEVALAAVEQADPAGDSKTKAQLLALEGEIQAGLDAARRDKALLEHLADIRSAEADDEDGSITDHGYAVAFREAEIDLDRLSPAESGARMKVRPASVTLALAGALDDWARVRRVARKDAAGAARLSEAARVADPDPWRNELRTALHQSGKAVGPAGLQALARTAKFHELGPISLHLLGTGLNAAGDRTGAESVLRRAQERHPQDVWINLELGSVLEGLAQADEAIRFYTAARAIRPETAHKLAHALARQSHTGEAIAVFRDLQELRPGNVVHLECLGDLLKDKGRSQEAGELFEAALAARREAVRLKPDDAHAQIHLANTLKRQGKLDEAMAVYRALIRLKPDDADAHHKLGDTLRDQGKLDEALAAQREAIRLQPDHAPAHSQVGSILTSQGKHDEGMAELRAAIRLKPDDADAHNNLGIVLCDVKRDYPAAEAEFRAAIRLRPDYDLAHHNLGIALASQGMLDEAMAAYRQAIQLRPDYAEAHNRLGALLCDHKHEYAAAEIECRAAVRLKPDDAQAHFCLGNALARQGKWDEAAAEFREAIRLQPENADAHVGLGAFLCDVKRDYPAGEAEFRAAIRLQPDHVDAHRNLGVALRAQGKLEAALASYRRVVALAPPGSDHAREMSELIPQFQREIAQSGQRLAAPKGQEEPIASRSRAPLSIGDEAPAISVSKWVKGDPVDRLDPRKTYVVEFWATWCGPCKVSIPHLTELQKKYRDKGVTFIGVSVWEEDQGAVAPFVKAMGEQMNYTVAMDEVPKGDQGNKGKMAASWMEAAGAQGIPTAFIVRDGKVAWIGHPMSMDEALEKASAREFDIQAAARLHREEKERQSKLTLAQAALQRREFADGTRLWAEVLASDPKLGDDLQGQHRHHAASCAAMAAVGQGVDDPRVDEAARGRFRVQARDWIRADLGLCSKMLDTGNAKDREVVAQVLQQWKVCPNLAGIRDAGALARLPEPERKEWRSLWANFDTLLERAQGHPAKAVAAASPRPAKDPEPVPNPTPVDVNTVLGDLRQAGSGPLADKLAQEIQQARDRLELSRKRNPLITGHVIVGRVICEGGDDPSRVVSQLRIHSEGYFVGPVKESGRPIEFRRQGFLPAQITPAGQPSSVEYVGEVHLKRMTE
jgi:tetratricopeptide (TPR) repeat protein/thiol-disulfide isomerase/thioredoxin/tRNA A-37 threonylcarbamoyl transferase component Bud32